MLSAAHTIISLPFGLLLQHPAFSFIAAFCMHILCDMMLHWNIYPHHYKRYPFVRVAIDIGSGLLLAYFILGNSFFALPVLSAIAGGNAPDVLHGIWSFLSDPAKKRIPAWIQKWFFIHEKVQWETESPLLGGLSQIIIGGAAIIIVLYLR